MAFAAPAAGITVTSDVQYGASGGTRLAMDIYRRATLGSSGTRGADAGAGLLQSRDGRGSQPAVLRRLGARRGVEGDHRHPAGPPAGQRSGRLRGPHRVPVAARERAGHRRHCRLRGIGQCVRCASVRPGSETDGDQGGGDVLRQRADRAVPPRSAGPLRPRRARSSGRQRVDRVACLARRRAERAADAAQQRGRASRLRADRRQRRDAAGDRADAGLRQAGIVRGVSVGASRVTRRGDGRRLRADAQVRRRGEGLRANRRVAAGRSAAAPRRTGKRSSATASTRPRARSSTS